MTIKSIYNVNTLEEFCLHNEVKLVHNYAIVNRDTIIEGYCKTENCSGTYKKGFRVLNVNKTFYCDCCLIIIKNEKKKKTGLDALEEFCLHNQLKLVHNYELVNIDTKIEGYCKTENCIGTYKKAFKMLNDHKNFYCNPCLKIIKNEKMKQTCLEKYGHITNLLVEETKNKCHSQETIIKRKQTNLIKYGTEVPSKNELVKEKSKQTMMDRYGVNYASQNEVIKNKIAVSNKDKIEETKRKIRETNLQKYGVTAPAKNEAIKEKIRNTNLQKYGFECALLNKNVQHKTKQTNLLKYGVEHPSQNQDIKNKVKQTCLDRFGVEYALQSEEVKDRGKQTSLQKYGYEHYQHNKIVSENASKKAYKLKPIITPSGKEIMCQGYEVLTLLPCGMALRVFIILYQY